MISRRAVPIALASLFLFGPFLLRADDCTPIVSSVAQPDVFPNRPATAIASTGVVFGVTKAASDRTGAVYFSTYDQNLNQVTPDVLVTPQSAERALAVVWNGTDFGIFYRTTSYELMLQRAGAGGTLTGAPIMIAPHQSWSDQTYDFLWDPVRQLYLIALASHQSSNGLYLVGVTRAGSIQLDQLVSFFVAGDPSARMAEMSNGTLGIVWGYPDNNDGTMGLKFAAFDAKNAPTGAGPIANSATAPRIATDGQQFLIIFSAPRNGGGTELHSIRMNPLGTVATGEAKFMNGKGQDITPVWVLWNPTRAEWALSYLDAALGNGAFPPDYRLVRFDGSGTVMGDTLFSPEELKNLFASQYPFLPAGTGYVTSSERVRSQADGSESYLTRLCPLTANFVAAPVPVVGVPVTLSSVTTGGTAPLSYVWDFGDATSGKGASTTHTFVQPATYTVSLTVTDGTLGTSVSRQMFVVVRDPCAGQSTTPVPVIVSADKSLVTPNDVITFTTSGPYTFRWLFGDGSSATGVAVTHRFSKAGSYQVIATASDANGCTAGTSSAITIRVFATSKRRAK